MNLRLIDQIFLLPRQPEAVHIADPAYDAWRPALEAAGYQVRAQARGAVQLGGRADHDMVALLGRPQRWARRPLPRRWSQVQWVGVPRTGDPLAYLPLDSSVAWRYLLRWLAAPVQGLPAVRNGVVGALSRFRVMPGFGSNRVTVAAPEPGPPWMVRASSEVGVRAGSWLLLRPAGDVLTRMTFLVFPPGGADPVWAVKFARTSAATGQFDLDERGLRLAAAVPPVSGHAPRLISRFVAGGLPAAVETAAVGEPLSRRLVRHRGDAHAAIRRISRWLRQVALATAGPPEALAGERARLRELAARSPLHPPADLVDGLPPVPSVFGHRDLGAWNVVASGDGFTVLDWERARSADFPLWDLLYFLTAALGLADGAVTAGERLEHARALHLGRLPASAGFFELLRGAAADLGLDWPTAGRLATLCWLHHSESHTERREGLAGVPGGIASQADLPPAERIARVWFQERGLAPTWDAAG